MKTILLLISLLFILAPGLTGCQTEVYEEPPPRYQEPPPAQEPPPEPVTGSQDTTYYSYPEEEPTSQPVREEIIEEKTRERVVDEYTTY